MTDIGLIAEEKINDDLQSVSYSYVVNESGDLSRYFGYKEFNCEFFNITEIRNIKIDEPVDIIVQDGLNIRLTIENGRLTNINE